MTRLPLALVCIVLAACGSSSNTDAGVDASIAASGDLATLDAPPSDAAIACGTSTCSGAEVCVRPCCGGAVPTCEPPVDGGGCAPGTTSRNCYGDGGLTTGCALACTPPPSFCAPPPAAGTCTGGFDCAVCPSGGSGLYDAARREVGCLCA